MGMFARMPCLVAGMVAFVAIASGCSVMKPDAAGAHSEARKEHHPDPAAEMWVAVRNSEDPEAFKQFIGAFPNSPYVHAAAARLDALTAPERSAAAPGESHPSEEQPSGEWIWSGALTPVGAAESRLSKNQPSDSTAVELPSVTSGSTRKSSPDWMSDSLGDFKWDNHVTVGDTVTVRGVRGSITILRSRGGGHVRVEAAKTGRRDDPNDVEIRATRDNEGVLVCAIYPPKEKNACDRSRWIVNTSSDIQVAFRVWVPDGVNLNAMIHQGDISVNEISGSVWAENTQGDIMVTRSSASVHAETGQGDITVTSSSAGVHAETTQGDITVTGSSAGVHAETRQGDIDLEGSGTMSAKTTQGDIEAVMRANPVGSSSFHTAQGNVTVMLPPGINAIFDIRTHIGRINGHSMPRQSVRFCLRGKQQLPVERCEIDRFSGGKSIDISTTSGDVELKWNS